MALYLGSSEINPVETVEVIKEVPTEQDLTLMGNELRKACAYTNETNIKGMYRLYLPYYNIYTEPFEATTINYGNEYGGTISSGYPVWVVIDGKLYKANITTTTIVLTQIGTDSDWSYVRGSIGIKNNNIGSVNSSGNFSSYNITANNFYVQGFLYYSSSYFINNGNLYKGSTLYDSGGWSFFKDSMINSNLKTLLGIKNNQIYCFNNAGDTGSSLNLRHSGISHYIYDSNLYSYNFGNLYLAVDSTFYSYTLNTSSLNQVPVFSSSTTLPNKIIKCDRDICLCENGDIYTNAQSSNPYKVLSNVKTWLTDNLNWVLTNDNKVYRLSNNSSSATYIGDFEGNVRNFKDYYISCVYYDSDIYVQNNMYAIRYPEDITKAYQSYLSDSSSNVTSKTDTSITVNNKIYLRNASNDNVFSFVPEDLENHIFSDTDLLEAYINAGARQ